MSKSLKKGRLKKGVPNRLQCWFIGRLLGQHKFDVLFIALFLSLMFLMFKMFELMSSKEEWSCWGPCSTSCGAGWQTRRRVNNNLTSLLFRMTGRGSSLQKRECVLAPCVAESGLGPWLTWSECSSSCGAGQQTRTRWCGGRTGEENKASCKGVESRVCEGLQPCPAHTTQASPITQPLVNKPATASQLANQLAPTSIANDVPPSQIPTHAQLINSGPLNQIPQKQELTTPALTQQQPTRLDQVKIEAKQLPAQAQLINSGPLNQIPQQQELTTPTLTQQQPTRLDQVINKIEAKQPPASQPAKQRESTSQAVNLTNVSSERLPVTTQSVGVLLSQQETKEAGQVQKDGT